MQKQLQICYVNLILLKKKDERLTNNKNGKVILVRVIVKSNLSTFFSKPGAIIKTNPGIKISIRKTKNNKLIRSILKTVLAKFFAFFN